MNFFLEKTLNLLWLIILKAFLSYTIVNGLFALICSISFLYRCLTHFNYYRLLVERLLNTCLVPYQLSPEERMKKLFHLFATMDENAGKAFIELQKHQLAVRKSMAETLDLHKVRKIAFLTGK